MADDGGGEAGRAPHEFVFELDRAIRDQVVERLNASPLLPLVLGAAPKVSGVYALYWKGELVYVL